MDRNEIALGFEKSNMQDQVSEILKREGYFVRNTEQRGSKLLRWLLNYTPKLFLVDLKFLGNNGSEIIKIILEDKVCHIGLIVSDVEKEKIKNIFKDNDNLFYIIKPLNKKVFLNHVDLMLKSINKIDSLTAEILELRETIEKRKLIEKAKGKIMKKFNISEAMAYRMMQKRSMEKRISMKEIAKHIIEE